MEGVIWLAGGTVRTLIGEWRPERIILVELPSWEHVERWHASPEYQALAPLRERSTNGRAIVVEGA